MAGVFLALAALFFPTERDPLAPLPVDKYTQQRVENQVREFRQMRSEPATAPSDSRIVVENAQDMPDAISNGFRTKRHSVVVDFEHYRQLDSIDLPRKESAVIQHITHQVVKLSKADHFRAGASTSGLDLYVQSNSPHTVFANDEPDRFGNYKVKRRVIEFDVSDVEVGSEFTLEHQKTYWNAYQGEDQSWAGFTVRMPTDEIEYLIIFPEDRPYQSMEFFANPPDGDPRKLERESYVLEAPDKTWLWWRAVNPESGMEYNVDWEW